MLMTMFNITIVLLLILIFLLVMSILKTLKGYAALMDKGKKEDGTVIDESILDGIKGKLREVLCESAPQSILQVF